MRIQPDEMNASTASTASLTRARPWYCGVEAWRRSRKPCDSFAREPELRVTNDAAHPTAPVVRLCAGGRRNAESAREGANRPAGDTRMAEGAEQQSTTGCGFALVPEIFAAIEHLGLFGNAELLRAHLTLQTEFVHVIVNLSTGEVSRIPFIK